MPAIFTKGDLFHTSGLRAYAFGCNRSAAMDQGVALAFKKRFPAMFEQFRAQAEARNLQLGDVLTWSDGDVTAYGLVIQDDEKTKPKLPPFSRALAEMVRLAEASGVEEVGMPRIGAGAQGLDRTRVKRILTEVGSATRVTLVVFEQFVRAPSA